jgi:hypothetical protein
MALHHIIYMGIPLNVIITICGNGRGVITSTLLTLSTLNKHFHDIYYHRVCAYISSKVIYLLHEDCTLNHIDAHKVTWMAKVVATHRATSFLKSETTRNTTFPLVIKDLKS